LLKIDSNEQKVILMILDGWGKSPDPKVSAIDNANIPFIKVFIKLPSAQLRTDGLNVGLPRDKWEIAKLDT
jgi:2,3-bisphosphoglycerate-independent phosphoglycerate mutase